MTSPVLIIEIRPRLRVCHVFVKATRVQSVETGSGSMTLTTGPGRRLEVTLPGVELRPHSAANLTQLDGDEGAYFRVETARCALPQPPAAAPALFDYCARSTSYAPDVGRGVRAQLECGCCAAALLSEPVCFARILPLPSDSWDSSEMFCHAHGAPASVTSRPGDLLFGPFNFILPVCATSLTNVHRGARVLSCDQCAAWLGVTSGPHYTLWNSTVRFSPVDGLSPVSGESRTGDEQGKDVGARNSTVDVVVRGERNVEKQEISRESKDQSDPSSPGQSDVKSKAIGHSQGRNCDATFEGLKSMEDLVRDMNLNSQSNETIKDQENCTQSKTKKNGQNLNVIDAGSIDVQGEEKLAGTTKEASPGNGLQEIESGNQSLESGNKSLKSGNKSLESGNKSLESGNKSLGSGNKSLESGNKSLESGNKSLESGNKSLESGNQSLESGNHSLESGNKSLESGNKSLESGNKSLESGNKSLESESMNRPRSLQECESGNKSPESGNQSLTSRSVNRPQETSLRYAEMRQRGPPSKTLDETALSDFVSVVRENIGINSKILVHCQVSDQSEQYLLLWVMDRNLALCTWRGGTAHMSTVMKVLYTYAKDRPDPAWSKDLSLAHVSVSKRMFLSALKHIREQAKNTPSTFRCVSDMQVSYIVLS